MAFRIAGNSQHWETVKEKTMENQRNLENSGERILMFCKDLQPQGQGVV